VRATRLVRFLTRLLSLCVFATGLSGCAFYSTIYAYDGSKLLTTGPGLGAQARVVGRFEEHDRQFYLLYGLLPVGERVNGAELAAHALGDHDAGINLRMSDGQNLVDMLISYIPCVAGLLCGTWSTWVEGDIVDLDGPRDAVWLEPGVPSGQRVGPVSLPAKRDEGDGVAEDGR